MRHALLLLLAACSSSPDATTDTDAGTAFTLSSPDFDDGGEMPTAFFCERDGGGAMSPSLTFTGVPDTADSLALTMHFDPNPGGNGQVNHYWLLWDLDPTLAGLEAGNSSSQGTEGSNKDGVETGYTPPCSPSADETHTYTLMLHAIAGDPGLSASDDLTVDYATLADALDAYVVDTAVLTVVN